MSTRRSGTSVRSSPGALVVLGDRLGLYRHLADVGRPLTSAELAATAGCAERYVREWLNGQAASGYVTYVDGRYALSEEQTTAFTDENSPACVIGGFQAMLAATRAVDRLTAVFRTGEGLGWHEHHDDLFRGTERFFRPGYLANLTTSWIPALDGVEDKFRRGAKVADVGCGHGASTIITCGQQALLVLVYLRKGETFAELAAGFGISTATAWRYVTETVGLLAARSPRLRTALRNASRAGHAYVVIDGTLIPINRVAADRPFYSGKHQRHGMNLQVIATPDGDIVWVSGPLPGAVHDLTAARIWGILRELAASELVVLADKGYTGAGDHLRTPYKGKNKPASQKAANRAHAKLRGPGECANAQLKTWRILSKLRCCPWRAGQLAKAIHVLQTREIRG